LNPQGCGKGVEQIEVDPYSTKDIESVMRKVAIENGLSVGVAFQPFSKELIDTKCVKYSISRAWRLGKAVLESRKFGTSPMKVIEEKEGGKLLFKGKIVHIETKTEGGHDYGNVLIQGFGVFQSRKMRVEFQNENLIAELVNPDGSKELIASVPDLISIVDSESFQPNLNEDLKFGLRVCVIAFPSVPEMCTDQALKFVGPSAFGYNDVEYKPLRGEKHQLSEIHS